MPLIEFCDLTLRGIGCSPDAPPILDSISLRLSEHRIGIIGANGSGKSSLVRCINGLNIPDEGEVTVDGLSTAKRAGEIRRQVGFLFSNADNQIIMPTVAEDVGFSLRGKKMSRQDKRAAVTEILEQLELAGKEEQSPHTLSGGEKQLLALASILVMSPRLIIADEPTTLLDLRNRQRIAHTLAALKQQLIVVSHDLELFEGFDRVIWIDDGRIRADSADDDSVTTVLSNYRTCML
ncbi:energy-coupling factor ABC transporter ATP-binding protein [Corynebacterium sp.]|uniref:energy-coupling factor ABC transporter ATP-binding protein n=1 Tax=Corynebacterium sp. TaxID=1720 RepID=UPI002625924E|nr:ABC transporter ATP-binding protein [Corynebacterium sp.]